MNRNNQDGKKATSHYSGKYLFTLDEVSHERLLEFKKSAEQIAKLRHSARSRHKKSEE